MSKENEIYKGKNLQWVISGPFEQTTIIPSHIPLLDECDKNVSVLDLKTIEEITFKVEENGVTYTYKGNPYEVPNSTESEE